MNQVLVLLQGHNLTEFLLNIHRTNQLLQVKIKARYLQPMVMIQWPKVTHRTNSSNFQFKSHRNSDQAKIYISSRN